MAQVPRDPRAALIIPVRVRYASFVEFIETQSANISRSGMFLATSHLIPVATLVELELTLADGFPLLKGRAEVVRVSAAPPGIGVRFKQLDETSQQLIDRIVEVNMQEAKRPVVPLDFADAPTGALDGGAVLKGASSLHAGLTMAGLDLRIQINPATVGYFTNNPLLNMRLAGFVVPAPQDVALGTVLGVVITDFSGQPLYTGNAKVVAKHERRLGLRLTDADPTVLARLQAEIARYASPRK